jgi:glycosyltransferase involved in cell wall biosynthesis
MKILLLSDATMNSNAGGLSQTLYNIFSFTSSEDILCISSKKAYNECLPGEKYRSRYLLYQFELFGFPKNRFAKFLIPTIEWANFKINGLRKFKFVKKEIINFNPDVIISCSNGPTGLYMHHRLLDGMEFDKVFPYFMDDWMFQKRGRWLDQQIAKWVKKVLSENPSWLVISRYLSGILESRYNTQPKHLLEIHNPVDLSNAPSSLWTKKKKDYTLAYAGSLWPMHFDAFLVMAKAVCNLKKTVPVKLVLYTSKRFWDWRKDALEPLGVVYGGCIPYNQIHQKLNESDVLLLTSSFSKEWFTHSKGSVQTKITDYLKSRRLILSCGPEYSANHMFLKNHCCGICIETNDEQKVTEKLSESLQKLEDHQAMVENGWKLLEKEFSFEHVHNKLRAFLFGLN